MRFLKVNFEPSLLGFGRIFDHEKIKLYFSTLFNSLNLTYFFSAFLPLWQRRSFINNGLLVFSASMIVGLFLLVWLIH